MKKYDTNTRVKTKGSKRNKLKYLEIKSPFNLTDLRILGNLYIRKNEEVGVGRLSRGMNMAPKNIMKRLKNLQSLGYINWPEVEKGNVRPITLVKSEEAEALAKIGIAVATINSKQYKEQIGEP